ncbi:hypothetical protein SAMN06893096_112130, partial [Geodermatophilus pulveris]
MLRRLSRDLLYECVQGPHRVVRALHGNGRPAASYSPTPSPGQ